jgi:hypothetical protein
MQISEYDLEDMLESARYRTKHFWLQNINRSYQDAIINHTIIDQFKFFTIWPGNIYFYIDEDTVKKEPTVVRSWNLDNTFVVNPERMILLSVYDKADMIVIRYAETEHDILA